jgi:hypothetical protein
MCDSCSSLRQTQRLQGFISITRRHSAGVWGFEAGDRTSSRQTLQVALGNHHSGQRVSQHLFIQQLVLTPPE